MTKDYLLDAVGDVDERYIADAQILRDGNISSSHRRFPRKTMFLIAAIIVSLLAFTVYAAESGRICNWALDYLCGTNHVLEDSYARTAEEVYQNVNQTIEVNSCAVTLQAAISDGKRAFLSFHVVLPDEMKSDALHYSFEAKPMETGYPEASDQKPGVASYGWRTIPDGNPEDNEIDLLFDSFASNGNSVVPHNGYSWSFELKELCASNRDANGKVTVESIAQGPWIFHFTFSSQYSQEPVELIQEPVSIWAANSLIINRLNLKYPCLFSIESLQIRAMTATCTVKLPKWVPVGDFEMRPITLSMKNGDVIPIQWDNLLNDGSGTLNLHGTFPVPIDAGNIESVLFPGGIRVPVSETIQ